MRPVALTLVEGLQWSGPDLVEAELAVGLEFVAVAVAGVASRPIKFPQCGVNDCTSLLFHRGRERQT